jgi:hypothetical protein
MKLPPIGMLGLQLRFALTRFGWGNGLACLLLLIGVAAWLSWLPHLRHQRDSQKRELSKVTRSLAMPEVKAAPIALPRNEQNMTDFHQALGETRYAEQQVKTLFAIAAKVGLVLSQGEYKAGFDRNGRFHSYQILLPVKGSYSVIRQFCQQTLLAIPFASLDEITFKRDNIANPTLEAKLHLTLFLSGPVPSTANSADADAANKEREAAR